MGGFGGFSNSNQSMASECGVFSSSGRYTSIVLVFFFLSGWLVSSLAFRNQCRLSRLSSIKSTYSIPRFRNPQPAGPHRLIVISLVAIDPYHALTILGLGLDTPHDFRKDKCLWGNKRERSMTPKMWGFPCGDTNGKSGEAFPCACHFLLP